MSRIKTAFLSGTITDNPLTAAATTINSAALANLPAIASPDIAVLVLDPAGSAGAPEVVYVTAHTASATFATISRAKEGTSAREHAQTIPWVQGPTIMDFAQRKGTAIASAGTLTLPDTDEDYFHVTGTTTITAISSRAGGKRVTLVFDGAAQITHHATSMILLSGANIITHAGLVLEFISEDSGNWRQVGPINNSYMYNTGAVTLTNQNTFYFTGSISLVPGTWLIIASNNIVDSTGAASIASGIGKAGTEYMLQNANVTVAGSWITTSMAIVETITSTTAYTACAKNSTRNGGTLSGVMTAIRLY